ncbi:uncharacterized protein I206_106738 [Kwoniella pini CBS 10737]|uniref:Uncharacterized protein n=1 Tax=Kwoniella pini CBS 10737 TaxID=1296096 RepID=A0A1B9HTC6_9TREE|nr:uncharacterized protein I206_07374 [Kwoniella pini CBS 10737]OCF46521.1 hypothetical protein I206_07374 [Kwoniella pini CBS 10737]
MLLELMKYFQYLSLKACSEYPEKQKCYLYKDVSIRPIWSFIILLLLQSVKGQSTNATCSSIESTSWMFNNDGESPCLVWSKIQSLCLPQTSYINVPPLLDQSYSYNLLNPQSSQCQCNSISYSLMSACALCQYPNAALPSEQEWSNGCGSYTDDGLGFNETVLSIPAFAFHQWSGGVFSPDTAQSSKIIPTQSYSTTLSRSFPPPSSTSHSNSSKSPSSSSSSGATSSKEDTKNQDKLSWGPILGIIVGVLIFLILIILLIRWKMTKNKSIKKKEISIKQKKIHYPYPNIRNNEKDDSFLEMLNSNSQLSSTSKLKSNPFKRFSNKFSNSIDNNDKLKREEELKKRTNEIMLNSNSFSNPRTAPIPFKSFPSQSYIPSNSNEKEILSERCLTTSQRLNTKSPSSISSSSNFETTINQNQNYKEEEISIQPKSNQTYSSFSNEENEEEKENDLFKISQPKDLIKSENEFRSNYSIISKPIKSFQKQEEKEKEINQSMDFSILTNLNSNSNSNSNEIENSNEISLLPSNKSKSFYNNDFNSISIISPSSQYPLTSSKTLKTPKSYYSQYTLNNYPGQQILLNNLKQQNETNRNRNSDDQILQQVNDNEIIGTALGSGKRGSWWEKRWSKSTDGSY